MSVALAFKPRTLSTSEEDTPRCNCMISCQDQVSNVREGYLMALGEISNYFYISLTHPPFSLQMMEWTTRGAPVLGRLPMCSKYLGLYPCS